jgi:hypothetical protein
MALYHYTNGITISDNETNSIGDPTTGELTYQVLALRAFDDSYLRSIWYPRVGCHFTGTQGAPLNWWVSAKVYVFWTFDGPGSATPGDPFGDDPDVLGIADLEPVVKYTATAGVYSIDWVGPRNGVRLQTARKGFGTHLPGVLTTFVFDDPYAVFHNPSGYTNRFFAANLTGRINWGSSVPRTP